MGVDKKLTETQVFHKLEKRRLLEGKTSDVELKTYSSRNISILLMKLRQVANIKDKDIRYSAYFSLLVVINLLDILDSSTTSRFLPIIRGINKKYLIYLLRCLIIINNSLISYFKAIDI